MHLCSICKKEFTTEAEYVDHTCITGVTPADFEHQVILDPQYAIKSIKALQRGAKQVEKEQN